MRTALLSAPLVLALLIPAAAPAADNPWLDMRVLNIAHQGGEDEFPSNTLYAFKRSVKAGADMLELDVGVTKDGTVVVSHDTTLDRTTSGHGTIESHTARQIRRLDGAYWFSKGDDAYRHGLRRKA
jgi:glycerophosphoryl diester phosphodiesterase